MTKAIANISETRYHRDTAYAVFGLVVREGRIVDLAPDGRWMIGKSIQDIQREKPK